MKFDNADFKAKATESLSILDKLKASMNFGTLGTAASKSLGGIGTLLGKIGLNNPFKNSQAGLSELQRGANSFQLQGMTGAVTGVSSSFIAMSTVAITALSNIVNRAVDAGLSIGKSLTIDPVKTGLDEYETNLNSVQTILANTKVSGADLDDVNAALDELNHYADKTIYNFSEMARNIGTFTAAGVDLDTATSSIKGIANLAALSGSNSQQASTAMYQLSQEIAAGRVSLMGWNSVVNAGMGGSTFQRALVTTAQNMGTLNGKTVEFQGKMKNATIDGKSFRDSIMAKPGEQSWLTSKVLTDTLEQFTGDMTAAELRSQGFTDSQIKEIRTMAQTAQNAATKVKTLSGVMDTAREVVGSGWAKTWQIVFGDFKEAKQLFTGVSNGLNNILNGMAQRRNDLLGDWKELGGRDMLIEGLSNGFKALMAILKPVGQAFRDIFPPKTGEDLINLTQKFVELTKRMMPSKETAADIRTTFQGVFSIFSIIGKIISGVASGFKALFDTVGGGDGNFLNFTASVGAMITAFNQFLEKSGIIKTFFVTIGNIVAVPLAIIKGFASAIGSIFEGFDAAGAGILEGSVDRVGQKLSGLQAIGVKIQNFFAGVGQFFGSLGEKIGQALSGIGDAIANSLSPDTFDKSLDVINTTLLGAIVLMIKNFFNGDLTIDLGGGLFDGIKETLGSATGALNNLQQTLKADILMKIALAIGVLALALFVLASIDPKGLARALGAMGIGFGALVVTLSKLMAVLGPVGVTKIYVISGALTKLALSLLLLSLALKVLSSLSFGEMLRGLAGLAGMLFILTKAMVPLAASSKGMGRASASLILVGIALNILAIALKIFASMSWEEMARGLTGVAGTLGVLAIAMKSMPKGMIKQAISIGILAGALVVLGFALKIFSTMSFDEMGRGLIALGSALGVISAVMRTMPKSMLITAPALVAVAIALNILAGALKIMGSMSWEAIAKGLVVLAGALAILSIGLNSMKYAIFGAAAMVVVAAALSVLVPILITLGLLSWETIIKGLTALAGVFAVVGLAGLVLSPILPVLAALAGVLLVFSVALLAVGAAAFLFGTGFALVVASGTAGVQVMAQMIGSIIKQIPAALAAFGQGVVKFAQAIGQGAPKIAAAFGRVLSNILNAVIRNTPKLAQAFLVMLTAALRVIVTAAPKIADAGLRLIIAFLAAISKRIPRIIDLAADIIVKFINGVARNLSKIINAGVNLILKFVQGVTRAINEHSEELGRAGAELGLALVRGMASAISGGAGAIKDAAVGAAKSAFNAAKDFLGIGGPSKLFRDEVGGGIPKGMSLGIRDETPRVGKEITDMGNTAMRTLKMTMRGLDDAFALDPNLNPTVTPVLDLTQLSREATKMSSILATSPVIPSVSTAAATDISAASTAAQGGPDDGPENGGGGGDTYTVYEQHLHSPKALDPVDVWRGTKSLFAMKKEELTK